MLREIHIALLLIFFSAGAGGIGTALASPPVWVAKRLPSDSKTRIRDLEWEKSEFPVQEAGSGEPSFKVSGKFARKGTLIWNSTEVSLKDGKFELVIPLLQSRTVVDLTAVDVYGGTETESVIFEVTGWKKSPVKPATSESKHAGGVSTGLTKLAYDQTAVPSYSGFAITVKGTYRFRVSPRWDVGGNVFFNALPLSGSDPNHSVRFLGANLRAGIKLPWLKDPWTLSISPGVYWLSMFVTNNAFGFTNAAGPQLFPMIRRTFSEDRSAYFYLKFSPVSDSFGFRSFANRELALGGGYTFKRRYTVSLDVSNLQVVVQSITARLSTVSLGFGLEF